MMPRAIAAFVLVFAAPLLAQERRDPHAVQPERPTVATHAGTVAPRWAELETGVELDRISDNANDFMAPSVLKLGLASNAQLSLFLPLSRSPAGSLGAGDWGVGIKWRLLDDAPMLGDFAILPSLKFPTGSTAAGRGTGTTDASIVLISSHSFGDVAMDLNVGYTRRSGDGTAAPQNATMWTASFGGPVAGQVGWVAELFGYPATSGPAGEKSTTALLGGPTLMVHPWLVLDAGVIVPVSGPQPRGLYAGATWSIGRW
jgi:hypothetical protein